VNITESAFLPCVYCKEHAVEVEVVIDPGEDPDPEYPGFPVRFYPRPPKDCYKCGMEVPENYYHEMQMLAIEEIEEMEGVKRGPESRWELRVIR